MLLLILGLVMHTNVSGCDSGLVSASGDEYLQVISQSTCNMIFVLMFC